MHMPIPGRGSARRCSKTRRSCLVGQNSRLTRLWQREILREWCVCVWGGGSRCWLEILELKPIPGLSSGFLARGYQCIRKKWAKMAWPSWFDTNFNSNYTRNYNLIDTFNLKWKQIQRASRIISSQMKFMTWTQSNAMMDRNWHLQLVFGRDCTACPGTVQRHKSWRLTYLKPQHGQQWMLTSIHLYTQFQLMWKILEPSSR